MESYPNPPMYEGIPNTLSTPPINFGQPRAQSISLVEELSPQKHLRNLLEELKGKLWDERLNKYVEVEGIKPLMNDEGRDVFFHLATATISPIVTMSNYTKDYEKIHAIVLMQIRKAVIHFHLHWKDYGITRKSKISIIGDKLMILALSCFYKALGAGDRAAATRNIYESINTLLRRDEDPTKPAQQKNIFGKMAGR